MAHFAQLDENNIVLQVIVVADSDAVRDASLPRSAWNEAGGIAFCKSLLGADTNWVQTSYNNNIRFRYAGVGMKYDSTNDVFYVPQPYASWTLNTSTWEWEPPVALPSDKGYNDDGTEFVTYTWNEASLSWKKRTDEL
jgi:hypothetical protein|tara:strand:- start:706 stop:1119 length:414 start_codon:yes stop_codon:yes gene_type:complete